MVSPQREGACLQVRLVTMEMPSWRCPPRPQDAASILRKLYQFWALPLSSPFLRAPRLLEVGAWESWELSRDSCLTPRLDDTSPHPHPHVTPSTLAAGDRQQQGQMVWVMFPPLLFSLPSPGAGATGSCCDSGEMLSLCPFTGSVNRGPRALGFSALELLPSCRQCLSFL